MTKDNLLTLEVKDLHQKGYIKNQNRGVFQWVMGQDILLTANIETIITPDRTILKIHTKGSEQEVEVLEFRSGAATRYYLICPLSGRKCYKLYYYCGQFMSSKRVPLFYESCTIPPCDREAMRMYNEAEAIKQALRVTNKYMDDMKAGKRVKLLRREAKRARVSTRAILDPDVRRELHERVADLITMALIN